MSDVSRRTAFLTLAAGAAGATGMSAAATESAAPARAGSLVPTRVLDEAAEVARRLGREVERRPGLSIGEATVLHCRSWDGHVYLYVNEQVRGFVALSAPGLAIAAACQAAERPVAVMHWGHDPRWGGGVGRFEGALLAMDARDLPEGPSRI